MGVKLAIIGLDDSFGEDQDKVDNGAWVPIAGMPDASIRIRSQGSIRARNKSQLISRNHGGDFRQDGTLPIELIDADQIEMLATTLVAEWKGFVDVETGKPVPCTAENVRAVVDEYPPLRRYLWERSLALTVFAKEKRALIAKNSEPLSSAS